MRLNWIWILRAGLMTRSHSNGRRDICVGLSHHLLHPVGYHLKVRDADEAIFFLMRSLPSQGLPTGKALDIFRVVEWLYQRRCLTLDDFWVIKRWGARGYAPPPLYHGEARIWRAAMRIIEERLRDKGII